MRIAFVSNLYPPEVLGGYEILCARVAGALIKRGHQVGVLSTRTKTHAGECRGPTGERVCRELSLFLPFGSPPRLARGARQGVERSNRRAAAAFFGSFQPEVVLVWSQLRLGLAAAREAEREGLVTAYTMNDDHVLSFKTGDRRGIKGALRGFLEQRLFPASTYADLAMDPVIAISQTVRSRLASVDPRFSKALIAMQGIPLELFPAKADIGCAHRPFRILYAGQLHPYKGVHTILEALALTDRERFSITIAGAGDVPYERALRAQADTAGLQVHFLGRVPPEGMGALYREADLLVFPSIWDEPFGLTHLEAMASGTPVASVAHGGPAEFLVHKENALLFEKEQAQDLLKCIEAYATDEQLRRSLAEAGRKTVEESFTIERYAARLEAILVDATKRDSP